MRACIVGLAERERPPRVGTGRRRPAAQAPAPSVERQDARGPRPAVCVAEGAAAGDGQRVVRARPAPARWSSCLARDRPPLRPRRPRPPRTRRRECPRLCGQQSPSARATSPSLPGGTGYHSSAFAGGLREARLELHQVAAPFSSRLRCGGTGRSRACRPPARARSRGSWPRTRKHQVGPGQVEVREAALRQRPVGRLPPGWRGPRTCPARRSAPGPGAPRAVVSSLTRSNRWSGASPARRRVLSPPASAWVTTSRAAFQSSASYRLAAALAAFARAFDPVGVVQPLHGHLPARHSLPRLTGCSGLPSTLIARPSKVRTTSPQPAGHSRQAVAK